MQDTDNIIEFLEKINNIWAGSVEIAIGTWLLERQLGATCVVPLIVTLSKSLFTILMIILIIVCSLCDRTRMGCQGHW